MSAPLRLFVVADFNAETLARYLSNTALEGAETQVAAGGPVVPTLAAGPPGPEWTSIVWTRPDLVSATFQRACAFEPVNAADALEEVRAYASALARFAHRTRAVLTPTWIMPPFERAWGLLDRRPGIGVADLLARMNLALADAIREDPSIFLLDAQRWLSNTGANGWSQKLWYATKSPFAPSLLEQAASDIAAAVNGLAGRARRVLVLDLDEVLWGGIVGEVGWSGLRLGGHDHVGEAFADFQRALKALTRRGILLAVVSKNDEAVALEAIDRHPEMQLRRSELAAWRINWRDKAENVAAVLGELNLGAESAVFIDDQPIERERVRSAIPDILVPDWPADPCLFREALAALRCFDAPAVTAEDRERTGMAAVERTRRAGAAAAASADEWMRSLEIRVEVEPLTDANLERAAQLFNKTNQMNLSTRRMTKSDLAAWASAPDHLVLTFRVSDRFGDSGLTGVVGVEFAGGAARLVDFLLSCRVMGRHVEETMLHVAVDRARARGASALTATFQPTPRNAPCLEFFRRSGMQPIGEHEFAWNTSRSYERPEWVTVHARHD